MRVDQSTRRRSYATTLSPQSSVLVTQECGRTWLLRATAPAPRSHAVLRVSLPGLDLGADAIPARHGAAGYVEIWAYPVDTDEVQPLLHLFGTPALPLKPAPRAQPRRSAEPIPLQPRPREPQIFILVRGEGEGAAFHVPYDRSVLR